MEKCTLASSPNWYLSQILDCSWDNKVAYGSLTTLVVFDPIHYLHPVTINHAHTSKILSVSFPVEGFGNRLLSTSESGEAFVWNLDTYKVALFYRHPQKCALFGSWSSANGDLVVCADENGNLLLWSLSLNTVRVKSFREHSFVVVSSCPHDQHLVATGTKQGLVCVINIKVPGKEFVVHKLRGHDAEVVALAWCPTRENIINPKIDKDCLLLASAAKERKIFFWRAGQDGLYESFVEIPFVSRNKTAAKHWNCISWFDQHQLLVSTVGGEVLLLDVSKIKSKKGLGKGHLWSTFSDSHNHCHVVVKSSPLMTVNKTCLADLKQKKPSSAWVWTFGADRVVTGICSDKQISPIKMNTIGGPVHAMAISPIDGASLAIGVADKSIRVVNLSDPHVRTMQTFNQKVSGKVMSLAWHPSKDGWLAYGTCDGRIGIHFTCTIKQPLLLRPFTKESIYAMEWGPTLASIKASFATKEETEGNESEPSFSKYVLYSVGGGNIAAIDPNNPDQIFNDVFKVVLKTVIKPESLKLKNKSLGLTDLAWKPDFSLLALGDLTGSIHLLSLTENQDLLLVSSLRVHSSLIQDLSWHPNCCATDVTSISPHANWLASSSNDVTIKILDTTLIYEALHSLSADVCPLLLSLPCIATLKGHKLRVSKVTWSPHVGGLLLSVSYDQCAQVWDVINHKPLACNTVHNAPLFSCVWSPFNPHLVITAGQEGLISIWNVEEQEMKSPVEKPRDGSNLLEQAQEAKSPLLGIDSKGISGEPQKVKEKKREKAILPLSGPVLQQDDSNIEILKHLIHSSVNDIVQLQGDEELGGGKQMPLHYAFFANQAIVEQYLMKESKSNVTQDISFTLEMWKGSPKDAIAHAIETKTINSFMVSVAPTVSHKVWVEACAAYAEQLKSTSEFAKASAYLLAIHKVEEAVKLLAENGKYRHAVAVARCRLPSDSPLIKSLLLDWAEESLSQGQQSLAAVCFGSAGEWAKAAQCLALKKTCKRLLLAAEIMKLKCEDLQMGKFYARESFDVALSQADWPVARSVLSLFPSLNHLALPVFIHESIMKSVGEISVADWIKLSSSSAESNPGTDEDQVNVTICFSNEKVLGLKKDLINEVTVNSEETAWIAASSKVTLAYLAAPSLFPRISKKFAIDNSDNNQLEFTDAYRHLVQVMSLMYHFHITNRVNEDCVPLFLKLCVWLAPQGPFHADSMFSSAATPLQSSLRSFLAAGILIWMVKANVSDEIVTGSALSLIDNLKSDIFSPESLRSFKVDFKLKMLRERVMSTPLKERQENTDTNIKSESKPDDAISRLSNLSISNNGSKELDSPVEESPEDLKFLQNEETKELVKWADDFREKRERMPNPYLSYSNLVQIFTLLKTSSSLSEIQEKFAKFWVQSNNSLDI